MESSYVSSKGQIVIPAELRKKYGITKGTKVNFIDDGMGGIRMMIFSRKLIEMGRGMLKTKSGRSVLDYLMEEKEFERNR